MGINLKTNFYSPLRYPGGKGRLAFYIQLLAEYNLLTDGHYVEPYAGGSSVALSMLFNEYSSEIHINDIDYNVYSFWYSVLNNSEQLCDLIYKTEVSIENWKIQKYIQANPSKYSTIEVGFSTFFLNRTNRSGILKAGVIGGNNQQGDWKIDARFNKAELVSRILRVSRYKERINLYNLDAVELIGKLKNRLPKKTFFYFDPPYYNKGKELYINFYNHQDHIKIASTIESIKHKHWLVSYDNNSQINQLYQQYRQQTYDLNYHAGKASKGSEILIFSDKMLVPETQNPTSKLEIKNLWQQGLGGQLSIWKDNILRLQK
jgi:DNA adenine methylase